MVVTSRSRVPRWSRIALAVLALAAGNVSIMRTALDAPCARAHVESTVTAGLPAGDGGRAATFDGTTSGTEAPPDAPDAPAPQCATSVATLPPPVEHPIAVTTMDAAVAPLGPQARPATYALPPPFRPPRVV